MAGQHHLEIRGYCPICEKDALFIARGPWYRGSLSCTTCTNGSMPRERALAHVLNRECAGWRRMAIHESSPLNRGISIKLRRECEKYIGTHYFAGREPGSLVDGFRNEDLEHQTFESESIDLVITLDVTEHLLHPEKMFREIYRTLKPGGVYISTFPIRKWLVEPATRLAEVNADGIIRHLKTPPEYHGSPINKEGSLVTYDYGYDIHQAIAEWAPFSVEITRFSDRRQGIIGEYTEVAVCRKPQATADSK